MRHHAAAANRVFRLRPSPLRPGRRHVEAGSLLCAEIDNLPAAAAEAFEDGAASSQVMLPGKKQRMEVPSDPFTGQTMVRPARFGSVMTASSGTIIHSPSRRTR